MIAKISCYFWQRGNTATEFHRTFQIQCGVYLLQWVKPNFEQNTNILAGEEIRSWVRNQQRKTRLKSKMDRNSNRKSKGLDLGPRSHQLLLGNLMPLGFHLKRWMSLWGQVLHTSKKKQLIASFSCNYLAERTQWKVGLSILFEHTRPCIWAAATISSSSCFKSQDYMSVM